MDRTRLAGYILIFVAIGLGIGIGLLIARLPAETGDVLSLAGSLVGAAIAVVGAVLVLEWQRQIEARANRRLLADLVQRVQDHCRLVRNPEMQEGWEAVPAMMTMVDFLQEAIDRAKGARQWVTPDSAAMVEAMAHIGQFEVDKDKIVEDARPTLFYGGKIDLDPHLRTLEARVALALSELRK